MEEPIEIYEDPPSGFGTLLRAAFGDDTEIQETILGLIPSPKISTAPLLEKNLPAFLNPSAVNLRPAESCITGAAARWTIAALSEATVPPRKWLGDLDIALRKKWLARARVTSLQHPTISNLYFPLWAKSFWDSLVDAVERKEEWGRAEHWVSGQVQDTTVYEAREPMRRIP